MKLNEFDIIQCFFKKNDIARSDVLISIGDDGAVTALPPDQHLVTSTDTLIAGTHFPIESAPYDIGYKSLAVNLSDLAAMGATPAWFTLAITLPSANEIWLTEFSHGLFDLAKQYDIQLIGGDTTRGSLSITIQVMGFLPKNQALTRSNAHINDLIYLTGPVGDAALGLQIIQKNIHLPDISHESLLRKLNRPEPKVTAGIQLRNIASAMIDISDGLAADLMHILESSQVGALVFVDQLPFSKTLLQAVSTEKAIHLALTGGDDYELCFTVSPDKKHLVDKTFKCIGQITDTSNLDLRYSNGQTYNGPRTGYQHFS